MITLLELLTKYQQEHRALPAFNIDTFEIYQAVELAVKTTGLACLVQLSPGEDQFIEAERLFILVKRANAHGLPIYLNMDHGKDLNRLLSLVSLGFDMLHFDGSFEDFTTNLSTTKYFIDRARTINPGILIEAEINRINLVDTRVTDDSFTSPVAAKEFIAKTGADLFAVSIGNLHGVNTSDPEHLNISLLSEIRQALPDSFLTLHGGSGIPLEQIKSAIALGVVKININTDLRLKFRESLQNQLVLNHSEKIYDYLKPVVNDLVSVITQKLTDFGQ